MPWAPETKQPAVVCGSSSPGYALTIRSVVFVKQFQNPTTTNFRNLKQKQTRSDSQDVLNIGQLRVNFSVRSKRRPADATDWLLQMFRTDYPDSIKLSAIGGRGGWGMMINLSPEFQSKRYLYSFQCTSILYAVIVRNYLCINFYHILFSALTD